MMTTLREQAVNILRDLPDDKMSYVVDMLKCVTSILADKNMNISQTFVAMPVSSSETIEAWGRLKKYKGIIPYDIDERKELARARDEKYAGFN